MYRKIITEVQTLCFLAQTKSCVGWNWVTSEMPGQVERGRRGVVSRALTGKLLYPPPSLP